MSYLAPAALVKRDIEAGEAKVAVADREAFGAVLFPVGFSLLYLLGYGLPTGVAVLAPLALMLYSTHARAASKRILPDLFPAMPARPAGAR